MIDGDVRGRHRRRDEPGRNRGLRLREESLDRGRREVPRQPRGREVVEELLERCGTQVGLNGGRAARTGAEVRHDRLDRGGILVARAEALREVFEEDPTGIPGAVEVRVAALGADAVGGAVGVLAERVLRRREEILGAEGRPFGRPFLQPVRIARIDAAQRVGCELVVRAPLEEFENLVRDRVVAESCGRIEMDLAVARRHRVERRTWVHHRCPPAPADRADLVRPRDIRVDVERRVGDDRSGTGAADDAVRVADRGHAEVIHGDRDQGLRIRRQRLGRRCGKAPARVERICALGHAENVSGLFLRDVRLRVVGVVAVVVDAEVLAVERRRARVREGLRRGGMRNADRQGHCKRHQHDGRPKTTQQAHRGRIGLSEQFL